MNHPASQAAYKKMTLLMPSRHTRIRKTIRRRISIAWGNAWSLRSRFITESQKTGACDSLSRHQKNMLFVPGTCRTGIQLISDMLNRIPDSAICACCSRCAAPPMPFRWWQASKLPAGARVAAFPGSTNPDDAADGIWPATWISDFWHE